MVDFLEDTAKGVMLKLRVHPCAGCSAVRGVMGERLKIDIAAQPEGGRANKELIKFLARLLKIGKDRISILRGEKGRDKSLLITGMNINDVSEMIHRTLKEGEGT